MGKQMIDEITRRDASWGRKSKAGGGKKSKATQLYTPLHISIHNEILKGTREYVSNVGVQIVDGKKNMRDIVHRHKKDYHEDRRYYCRKR